MTLLVFLIFFCVFGTAVVGEFIVPRDEPLGDVHIGTKIGETECYTSAECSRIARSQCKEGLCQCLPTHIPHSNHDRCLRIASAYDEPCEIDKQCPDGSTCRRKMCRQENEGRGSATIASMNQSFLSLLLVGAIFM